jgi:hypothetical protein
MELNFDTPILLLIFNRTDVTQKVFNKIKEIKAKYLFVCADGPRPGREDDKINCKLTREIINQVDWDCEVKTLFRDENLGCGFSVCSGISWFFEQVDQGIVLEDDCLPENSFFPFCKELLNRYREDESIYIISGTNMQNGISRNDGSYFFSNYPITWGWASWRRAWSHFCYDIPDFDKDFKNGALNHAFQSKGEKKYWKSKVQQSVTEKKNIWDYQWWFAIWKNRGMAITPNVNLILNLGFRNTGAHSFLYDSVREPSISKSIQFPLIHPENKIINKEADLFTFNNVYSHSFSRFLRLTKENGLLRILKYSAFNFFKI